MNFRQRTGGYEPLRDEQDAAQPPPYGTGRIFSSGSLADEDDVRSLNYSVTEDPVSDEAAFLPIDDTGPHFTWRSVFVGLAIGCLLCFSNMYFGLQTGWISMMSLQSSLVGFVLFKLLERWLKVPFGPAENVILQTTAVATATMPLAGGFVGIVPALAMLTREDNPEGGPVVLNFAELLLWGMGLAFFGVFFAIPLRRQTIIKEKLKFPSGTATAQMISVLHQRKDPLAEIEEMEDRVRRERMKLRRPTYAEDEDLDSVPGRLKLRTSGPERDPGSEFGPPEPEDPPASRVDLDEETARQIAAMDANWKSKGIALCVSFVLSGGYTIASHLYPPLNALPIFGTTAAAWNWSYRPSLSYMGQGIIMGLPTCLAMLLGAVVGWGILSPVSHYKGWAPGPVNDWKTGPQGWILWISLAVMIAESLVSLGVMTFKELRGVWQVYRRRRINARKDPTHVDPAMAVSPTLSQIMDLDSLDVHPRYLVPNWVVYGGLLLSSALCVVAMTVLFKIPVYATILAVFIACLLSILGVRALGETDLNPVSGIGKVSQVIFAGVVPGGLVANLVAGGIAEAGAQQAGDMMQDLKTGHLLHASPRAQFYGQMLGSFFSVFVSVGAYVLYTSTYAIPGPEFKVPTAHVWLDMSRLVNGHALPTNSAPFIIGFALLFSALPILEAVFSRHRWVRYLPSGIAFAIGIYNPPDFTLARVTGALTVYLWNRFSDPRFEKPRNVMAIVVASGFVLGEGTLSLIMLCFGQRGSGGGGH
ncbi:OPT super [Tieghemiomyces parasiticus]|uniref:OPT super n=1 Tax=Tieghemiomyces parasiticus TaxID=78921 RepID=A0A9W8DJM3_9FUNG|nr:OPT super [Tieghemiomyces parasiticus]